MPPSRRVRLLLLLIWLLALALALLVDRRTAEWVRQSPLYDRHATFVPILKLPGNYLFTIGVAVLLVLFHRKRWQAALPVLISGPLVGIGYLLIKWIAGRQRPVLTRAPLDIHPFIFRPFAHGLNGLIHAESGLSFPSGHASLAFATATCLAAALPRWAVLFFLGASAVAAERVLENAHYPSDVVAGAGLGVLCGWIALALSPGSNCPETKSLLPMTHVSQNVPKCL
jgi:undecaprenyl-diphosphatase